MSETVVYVTEPGASGMSELVTLLDEFLQQQAKAIGLAPEAPESAVIMTTAHQGHAVSRKLAFQSAELAAQFLSFWRMRSSATTSHR